MTTLRGCRHGPQAGRDVIGANIRLIREKRQLSQRQLALNAGVSPSYIAYIEKGIRTPSLATLSRIARCLGVTPEAFFQNKPEVKPNRSKLEELVCGLNQDEIRFIEKVIEAYLQLRGR